MVQEELEACWSKHSPSNREGTADTLQAGLALVILKCCLQGNSDPWPSFCSLREAGLSFLLLGSVFCPLGGFSFTVILLGHMWMGHWENIPSEALHISQLTFRPPKFMWEIDQSQDIPGSSYTFPTPDLEPLFLLGTFVSFNEKWNSGPIIWLLGCYFCYWF